MTTETAALQKNDLMAIGGALWERDEMQRVYFNDLDGLYGLEVTTYNSGHVRSATLDGQPISNTQAREIIADLAGTLWYDLAIGRFMSRGIEAGYVDEIVAEIKRRLSTLTA
jgi:hypothetical protein